MAPKRKRGPAKNRQPPLPTATERATANAAVLPPVPTSPPTAEAQPSNSRCPSQTAAADQPPEPTQPSTAAAQTLAAVPSSSTAAQPPQNPTEALARPPPPRRSTRARSAATAAGPSTAANSDDSGSPDDDYEMEEGSDSASESFADSDASSAQIGDDAAAPKFPVEFSDPAEIEELLNFPDAAMCKAINIRRRKNFLTGKILDLAAIERLGVKDNFVGYFKKIGWSWLLSESSYPVYQELALEFFSTFKFNDTADLEKKCISFRLFNMHHELSLVEWSVKLGICTLEEVVEHEFRAAYCGLGSVESDVGNAGVSWSILARPGASPFDASRSSVYDIVDPVLRMCHLFLCYNLTGRSTTFSKVSGVDLFFLRCMHEGLKVNLGYWIASSMHHISTHPARHLTLCHFLGLFIARNFEFTAHPSMTLCKAPTRFDIDVLAAARVFYFNSDGEPRFYEPGENPPSMGAPAGPVSLEALSLDLQSLRDEFGQFRAEVTQQFARMDGHVAALQESIANLSATIRQELRRQRTR